MRLFSTFIEIKEIRSKLRKGGEGGGGEVIHYKQIIITDEKYIKHCQSGFLNGV